jgi:hypothetical protein
MICPAKGMKSCRYTYTWSREGGLAPDGSPDSLRAVRMMDWIVFKLLSKSSVADFGESVRIGLMASWNCEIFARIFSSIPMRAKYFPYFWLVLATLSSLTDL